MSDYTYADIIRMQNDAVKRVEEMQKKARYTAGLESDGEKPDGSAKGGTFSGKSGKAPNAGGANGTKRIPMPDDYLDRLKNFAATSSYSGESAKESGQPHALGSQPPQSQNGIAEKLKGMLGDINIDSDKALILSLILLLSEENADETLILALLYMLS